VGFFAKSCDANSALAYDHKEVRNKYVGFFAKSCDANSALAYDHKEVLNR